MTGLVFVDKVAGVESQCDSWLLGFGWEIEHFDWSADRRILI